MNKPKEQVKKINEKWIDGYLKRRRWVFLSDDCDYDEFFESGGIYHKDKYWITVGPAGPAIINVKDRLPCIEVYVSWFPNSKKMLERFRCIFDGIVYDKSFLEKVFYSIGIYN